KKQTRRKADGPLRLKEYLSFTTSCIMIYYFYQQIIREKIYLSMYYGFKYDTETAHCNNRTIIPSPPRIVDPP
ncbi:hypothetical protein, partial [Escherichia fergusonii]|uniref:hypothetical protein n=1 Tax=Escherichia fergusonii TaxID=564 RepID=UPI002231557B